MNERVVRAGEPRNPALASPPRITDAPRCMRPYPRRLLIYLFDELPMSFEPLFMKAPRRTAATSNGFSDAYRDVPCTPPARTNGTENVQHAKAIAATAVARLDMYRLTRASSAMCARGCGELVISRVGKNKAPFPFRLWHPQILSL